MSYCTISELTEYLGLTETGDNPLLEDLIARAQSIIDAHTGRTFEAAADGTRRFDAVRDVTGVTLFLDADLYNITSITNGDSIAVATNEYAMEPRNVRPYYAIRLLSSSGKAWTYTTDPENAITVVGKWAYSLSAPLDIAHACVRLAGWMYRQRDNAGEADRTVIAGNATILPGRLPDDVTRLLAGYRRLV